MIIGAHVISVSTFTTITEVGALYNRIDIYNGAGYDNLLAINRSMTAAEMTAYFGINQDYEWMLDTLLYAEFLSNLFGGNISIDDITNFILYRKNLTTEEIVLVRDDILPDASSTIDYTPIRNETYRYLLSAINADNETSNGIWSNEVLSEYYGWFLIDDDEKVAFKFDIDLKSSNLKISTKSKAFISPFAEKVLVNKSLVSYLQGTLNCKLGYMDGCNYVDNTVYMDQLISLVRNKNKKYLKDRKGNVYQIEIVGDLKFSYLDKISSQPTGISFKFVEVRPS